MFELGGPQQGHEDEPSIQLLVAQTILMSVKANVKLYYKPSY